VLPRVGVIGIVDQGHRPFVEPLACGGVRVGAAGSR
jgi:hypothetical protein